MLLQNKKTRDKSCIEYKKISPFSLFFAHLQKQKMGEKESKPLVADNNKKRKGQEEEEKEDPSKWKRKCIVNDDPHWQLANEKLQRVKELEQKYADAYTTYVCVATSTMEARLATLPLLPFLSEPGPRDESCNVLTQEEKQLRVDLLKSWNTRGLSWFIPLECKLMFAELCAVETTDYSFEMSLRDAWSIGSIQTALSNGEIQAHQVKLEVLLAKENNTRDRDLLVHLQASPVFATKWHIHVAHESVHASQNVYEFHSARATGFVVYGAKREMTQDLNIHVVYGGIVEQDGIWIKAVPFAKNLFEWRRALQDHAKSIRYKETNSSHVDDDRYAGRVVYKEENGMERVEIQLPEVLVSLIMSYLVASLDPPDFK